MALITVEELGNYIEQPLESNLRAELVVKAVNDWVASYTGNIYGNVKGGSLVTETFDYDPIIYLGRMNVQSIESIKLFGKELDVSKYKLNKQIGRLVLNKSESQTTSSRRGLDAIEVTYKAGSDSVPADLKLATLQLASEQYAKMDTSDTAGVTSASVAGVSVSFGDSTSSSQQTGQDGSYAPTSYMAVFNLYRRRRL